ncbi:hypothetical protein OG474_22765 [Kribbella sp. NBC_01505]|uniref:hypothetical protein n=1 Tax=Kribbella sp. NBC_01505 TaxID=2903580 RepID=UPI00386F39E0
MPTVTANRTVLLHSAVPAVIGIVAAVIIGADGGIPSALMMCAAIYLVAAAVGHPAAAWWGFAGTLPLIALGDLLGNEWVSLGALGIAQLIILMAGQRRRAWNHRHNQLQVVAAAGFAVLAIAAATGAPTAAALIVIVGLLAHAAWDLAYHHAGTVVTRSYAAFCAGFDLALAIAVAVALLGQ